MWLLAWGGIQWLWGILHHFWKLRHVESKGEISKQDLEGPSLHACTIDESIHLKHSPKHEIDCKPLQHQPTFNIKKTGTYTKRSRLQQPFFINTTSAAALSGSRSLKNCWNRDTHKEKDTEKKTITNPVTKLRREVVEMQEEELIAKPESSLQLSGLKLTKPRV